MTIDKTISGGTTTLVLGGRLDTTTSPELEAVLAEVLPTTKELIFDMTSLDYISSSGLRVMLTSQKKMNKQGSMTLKGVNEVVMEVFEVTGFSNIMTFA